ncbi:MAG TPA: hypothetical protein VFS43_19905 [Polyangiaceae bacterium]|nr:hypothetical protein [Polyangiaceae bacterium]
MAQGRGLAEPELLLLNGVRVPSDFSLECRCVTDRIAIGGMIGTAANVASLRRERVTHVINLQQGFDDAPILAGTGVALCWLGVPDALPSFPEGALRRAVEFARGAALDPGYRLYLHCMAGRSRSPLFAYAILRSAGWGGSDAAAAIARADAAALLRPEHADAVERFLRSDHGPARPGGATAQPVTEDREGR